MTRGLYTEEDFNVVDTLIIQLSLDGDQWCALAGENLQDGVAGFGDTPLKAIRDMCDQFAKRPYYLHQGFIIS